MLFFDLKKINERYADELKRAAAEVIDSGWYIRGKAVDLFEKELSDFVGCKYAVGTGNGLDALRLILKAYIELGAMAPGDEVILPANTYIATLLAVTDNGLKPVITDIDPKTMNLDTRLAEKAITSKTRAIMPVHLYGNCCWDERLKNIALNSGIKIIEDNAQAIGAKADIQGITGGYMTGHLGHASGTSFYPIKNLGALGDGGVVTTDDRELAYTVRALGNYGSKEKYVHEYMGLNSRLDEIQAAFLSVKLKYLVRDNEQRRRIAETYNRCINADGVTKPDDMGKGSVWHQYVIRSDKRDELKEYLSANGIETMIHYPTPLHKHEACREYSSATVPVAEELAGKILSLPISPVMTIANAEHVSKLVNRFFSA